MKKLMAVLMILISTTVYAGPVLKEVTLRENYYQQQMILMGLYVYGLKAELEKLKPSVDELSFLGESILDIIHRIRLTKETKSHHDDFDGLVKEALKLKKAKSLESAKKAAEGVMTSCGSCHSGAKKK